ncbi:hypothetical protein ACWCQE_37175 [Streptomyces sp. NPDC002409]
MKEQSVRALMGPEWSRVADARTALADAVADVRQTAPGVGDWTDLGTPDLVPAVQDLVMVRALHDQEDHARRVSEAFTVHPGFLYGRGIDDLAFGTAVVWLRLKLYELDAALNYAPDPERL